MERNRHADTEDQSARLTHKDMYCKEVYSWLVADSFFEEKLHSFDTHDEKFLSLSLPDSFRDNEYIKTYDTILTQWNDSVVLFCVPTSSKSITRKPIEMRLMHESSEGRHGSRCWTKHLSIGPQVGIFWIPITFWKN